MADALDQVGLAEDKDASSIRDDALLVTTEMLANAVRACRFGLAICLEAHRTWLKVTVADDSPAPAERRHPGPEELHGRGVDIVAMLSSDWGQTPWDGSTKTVWSRLDLPPGLSLAVECNEFPLS